MIPLYPVLCGLLLAGPLLSDTPAQVAPPSAKRVPHSETRHGTPFQDDFLWLRDQKNPATRSYLDAENAYAEARFAPLAANRGVLLEEIKRNLPAANATGVKARHHGYLYYSKVVEGADQKVLCRRKELAGAKEEVYLDLNELAKGHDFFQLGVAIMGVGARAISADNRMFAYSTDTKGDYAFALHVKDLETGVVRKDIHPRVTSAVWAADGKTLVYSAEADPKARRSNQVWAWTPDGTTTLLYEEPDPSRQVRLTQSTDGRFIFIGVMECEDVREVRALDAKAPLADVRIIFPWEAQARVQVDHHNGRFLFRTDAGGHGWKIAVAPVAHPERMRDLIRPRKGVDIQGMVAYRRHLVVETMEGGLPKLETFRFQDGQVRSARFPDDVYTFGCSNSEMRFTCDFEAKSVRLRYESPSSAPKVFDFHFDTGRMHLVQADPGPAQGRYVTDRVWVTARDGAKVPVSVVRASGVRKDGTAPLLITGYGFYDGPYPAGYNPYVLSLLDRGFVFAIAHVRGGSDLGAGWRRDGMGPRKINTFFDFIDCAEGLAKAGWCARDRMAALGASAGGTLVGAVANMRPDLFRAVVAEYPAMDYLNVCYDTTLDRLAAVADIPEVGAPRKDPEVYRRILAWSPMENVSKRPYPAMLLWASLNDSNVPVWHVSRYAAKMRAENPGTLDLVLRCDMVGTHGGSGGRFGVAERTATMQAWLLDRLGLTGKTR